LHKALKSHWRIKPYSIALPALGHPCLIRRQSGVARSIEVIVPPELLPVLV
jgi:hypothetical protein